MDIALAEGQKRIGRRPKKNWPKAKNALAEGQSPPQELEVSPRSGLYLLGVVILFVSQAELDNIWNYANLVSLSK